MSSVPKVSTVGAWRFHNKPFPFYAATKDDKLGDYKEATLSLAGMYAIMSFFALSLQKQIRPMSSFMWLSPVTISIPSANVDFNIKFWHRLISKKPVANNTVVPILVDDHATRAQYLCFCWIDKTQQQVTVFAPQSNLDQRATQILLTGLGLYPKTMSNSPADLLSLNANKNELKPGEIYVDANNFILSFLFETKTISDMWCVYYLIRRTGVSSWIPLLEETKNNKDRLNESIERVLKATLRLMRACVRSGSLETYMRMFEKGETYGIDANNIEQLHKIFMACSPSTSLSYKADLKTLIEAINGIESTSQDETPLKKVKILGGIVERNDLTDKDTRDKMRAFIPNNPQMARFPVFRV